MQKSFFLVTVLASTLTLAASTVALAKSNPAAVLKKHVDAIARGDVAGALALYTDDAVIDGGGPLAGGPCAAAPCVGKAAIQKELELRVASHQHATILKTYVSGNVVTFRAESRNDATQKAGVERIITWGILQMKDDKISYWHSGILERTDPQTARFIEWFQSQPPAR